MSIVLRCLLLFAACLLPALSPAQITGILTAPDGEPQEGAEVFINRSSIHAITDEFGQFALLDAPAGFQEIVAYKKGFALYRAPMRIQSGRTYTLNLAFAAKEKKPRGKSTPESESAFESSLLGTEGLLLYHPDTKVAVEMADEKFRVLSGPVIIEYPNAGYRIRVFFSSAGFQSLSDAAYCYQEYRGSHVDQNMATEKARLAIYTGSLRHWLTSVVAGKSREEGFVEFDAAGRELPSPPAAVPSASPGYSRIQFDPSIQVSYDHQEKTLLSATGPLDVNTTGAMINPRILTAEGPMNKPGLAHQLPLDYRPIKDIEGTFAEALRYFYEKVYVQTDKPYYYPGEPLWFKAYINYYNHDWKDSLSDVLYVELLNAAKEAKVERMYRIVDGMSEGDFFLPDSLPEGTYYLRAYTNLRLNFGPKGLFTKPLRVLQITDKADPSHHQTKEESSSLAITARQKTYRAREKVTLDLRLDGRAGVGAIASIAVTDAAQVIGVPERIDILNTYPIAPEEIPAIHELTQRIERGVSFYAQFLNNKGQPEKAQLSFIQWKTGDVLTAETDEDGKFWQTGLQFTDSAQFSYKSDKAKGRPYGKVMILPRDVPPLETPAASEFNVINVGTVQRVYAPYELPKDSKLLEEVEIRGKRAENTELERIKRRPYGHPDYVLTSKALNVASGNLLYALVGKIPGLVVNPSQGVVFFSRALGTSFTQSASPLVTVNDIPMAGDAGTVLQTIDFNTIESIEFTKRLNSLYGAQGANGVISVYTKTGMSVDGTDPNFQTIKLPGFSPTRKFQAPDYDKIKDDASQEDYRSTLYWNPGVKIDAASGTASVSFFASDLAGTLRVVVEGVTTDGRPIRAVTYLTVEEKP